MQNLNSIQICHFFPFLQFPIDPSSSFHWWADLHGGGDVGGEGATGKRPTGHRRAESRASAWASAELRGHSAPTSTSRARAWIGMGSPRGSQGVRPDNVLWKSVAFYVDSAWLKVLIKLKASVLIWDRITDWGPPVTQLTSHLKAEPGNILEYIKIFYHFTIHDKFRQQNLFQQDLDKYLHLLCFEEGLTDEEMVPPLIFCKQFVVNFSDPR